MNLVDIEVSKHAVRTSAILTGSYVAGTVFKMDRQNTLNLEIDFTIGSLTDLKVKIEVSNDSGTTYGQEVTLGTPSSGETTVSLHNYKFTASGIYSINIQPLRADLVKISVLGTGTATNSLCELNAFTSWT